MAGYLTRRILKGILSVVAVLFVVMLLIFSLMNRDLIFASDASYSKLKSNAKEAYKMQKWEDYGYLDFVPYSEYLADIFALGEIDSETYNEALKFGDTPASDNENVKKYVQSFSEYYKSQGYEITRLNAVKQGSKYREGGQPRIYAHKNIPTLTRLIKYIGGIITIDSIHYVKDDIAPRGITFTLFDPAYGGKRLSPAIMGCGTKHKYLLYFDSFFPFIHQNLITVNLGSSYSVNRGTDVFETMTKPQGELKISKVYYPSGAVAESADDIHTLTYVKGSYENGTLVVKNNFIDDYTLVSVRRSGLSKIGYSFVIGILSVILSYALAIPLGLFTANKKGKIADKLATAYIIFIIAVPSLAYIFLFKAIGGSLGLPTVFDMQSPTELMYVLPIISLALPSAASLMKWLRRYMIDKEGSDFVKFAKANGFSKGEIFRSHILKNAVIPIIHGIPASIFGALVGAIITERVYVVPGAGNLLTTAINQYDNGVIIGLTLFYSLLSVAAAIIADVLISLVDPRISLSGKRR